MTWNEEQQAQILQEYWQGQACCPFDGTPLKLTRQTVIVQRPHCRRAYQVAASCPSCAASKIILSDLDPQRRSFRRWSLAETDTLIRMSFQTKDIECPVCRTKLDVQDNHFLNQRSMMPQVALYCPRCQNFG